MRQLSEIIINGVPLEVILSEHLLWIKGKGGKRANLQRANLQRAYLQGAKLQGADLQGAYLRDADLQGAKLQGSDLRGSNLRGADLLGANLDFSCMPLWCGDLNAHYDDKQIIQQLYHVLSHVKHSKNVSDELKQLLSPKNLEFANRFHRVEECGVL